MKSIWRENPYGSTYWPSQAAKDAEKKLGVTRIYYPLLRKEESTGYWIFNDIQINAKFAGEISKDFEFAIYYHPEAWDGDRNAVSIVNKMDHAFQVCNPYVKAVQWDIEDHYVSDRVCVIVDYWRTKHPTGPISWTLEPFQGGWMKKNVIDKVNKDTNMVVVPQNFYGDMTPAGTRNGNTPKQELIKYGFASNRVKEFYDGKLAIPTNWDGCILSEERLPSYNLP